MLAKGCAVGTCQLPHSAKGYCVRHYQRLRNGQDLEARWRGSDSVKRDEEGRKLCWTCEEWLAVSSFSPVTYGADGLETKCHRCRTLGRHGLTKTKFAEMLARQGGLCGNPGCLTSEPGGRGEWHIDHDHGCCAKKWSCGECIRGLLCHNCNIGLGLLGDSPRRLEGLLAYMDNPPAQRV